MFLGCNVSFFFSNLMFFLLSNIPSNLPKFNLLLKNCTGKNKKTSKAQILDFKFFVLVVLLFFLHIGLET